MGFPRSLGVAATVAGLVVAGGAFAAPVSAASTIGCGSVVTTSVTLTQDLNCGSTSRNLLSIGANGITLDLGGHTISGNEGGISNAGFDNVTIRNGTVNSDFPVMLTNGSNGNHLSNLNGDTADGEFIWVQNSQGTLIDDLPNPEEIGGWAVELDNCTGATVRNGTEDGVLLRNTSNSTISGNTFTDGNGVDVSGSKNTITNNVINREQGDGISVSGTGNIVSGNDVDTSYRGIEIAAPASNTLVSGNTVINTQDFGIGVDSGTTGTLLQNNTARTDGAVDGADGIHSDSKSITISGNTATGNALWGIRTVAGAVNGGANSAYGNTAGNCDGLSCFGPITGNQVVGTKWTAVTLNAKRASRFAAPALTTASQLQLYMDGNGGAAGSEVMRAVIYTDNGGQPDQLLTTSNQVSVAKGRKAGWVAFTLSKPVVLQAGTYYWVGLHSGATGKVARYAGVSVTSALRWNTDTYSDGATPTFGAATADSTNMSIFAG